MSIQAQKLEVQGIVNDRSFRGGAERRETHFPVREPEFSEHVIFTVDFVGVFCQSDVQSPIPYLYSLVQGQSTGRVHI